MERIYVDFNTMMADPQRRIVLGEVDGPDGEELTNLYPGARIIVFDEDLEVEATAVYEVEDHSWLAVPDWSTRRDLTQPVR